MTRQKMLDAIVVSIDDLRETIESYLAAQDRMDRAEWIAKYGRSGREYPASATCNTQRQQRFKELRVLEAFRIIFENLEDEMFDEVWQKLCRTPIKPVCYGGRSVGGKNDLCWGDSVLSSLLKEKERADLRQPKFDYRFIGGESLLVLMDERLKNFTMDQIRINADRQGFAIENWVVVRK